MIFAMRDVKTDIYPYKGINCEVILNSDMIYDIWYIIAWIC